MKILVVDDEQDVRDSLSRAIEKLRKIPTLKAETGEQAWDLLQKDPDIIIVISDHDMPGMSGLDLLKKIRVDNRLKELGFILVSGNNGNGLDVQASLQGAAFFSKPCDLKEFLKKIDELIKIMPV